MARVGLPALEGGDAGGLEVGEDLVDHLGGDRQLRRSGPVPPGRPSRSSTALVARMPPRP